MEILFFSTGLVIGYFVKAIRAEKEKTKIFKRQLKSLNNEQPT